MGEIARLRSIDNAVWESIDVLKNDEHNKTLGTLLEDYYMNDKGEPFLLMESAFTLSKNNPEYFSPLKEAYILECLSKNKPIYEKILMYADFGYAYLLKTFQDNSKGNKSIYVIEMSNRSIKIGIACDVERRFKQICSSSGMDILKEYHTPKILNAFEIEQKLHRHFKQKKLHGEYFHIDFDDAVQECIAMIG